MTRSLRLLAVASLAASLCYQSAAHAGGLFLPVHDARPLGRAGAYVAGADDGSAIYYNPAGLSEVERGSFYIGGGLVLQRGSYDRIDSGGNLLPRANASTDILPIPTLALTYRPKKVPWLTLAGGVWIPYLGLTSYPEDGPQRYSSITLKGSLLAVPTLAASFRVHKHVSLGIGLQNMIFRFKGRVVLGTCTNLNCAPEDPSWDSLTEIDATSYFTPSANVGLTVHYPKWRGGFAIQLPFFVRASGTVLSRLPTDPFFANAEVHGTAVNVNFNIPVMVRAGVEYRPIPEVRIEGMINYEAWSMHKSIEIQPRQVYIAGVPGIGTYYLGNVQIDRSLRDSISLHLGLDAMPMKLRSALLKEYFRFFVRAGYFFETSATPDDHVSTLSPDGMKHGICFGLGMGIAKAVRLDIGYAHVFTPDRVVTNSQVLQLNPIQPPSHVVVGNGTYRVDTDILAVGLDARF